MNTADTIASGLRSFRIRVEHAAGHGHLYRDFDAIIACLTQFRTNGAILDEGLAQEILNTVDLLLRENSVGRRPWTGNWEPYFAKCLEDAHRLLSGFTAFATFRAFSPRGYCNQFLDAFAHMDRHDHEYERSQPEWSRHFARLASLAAEMFCWVADGCASVDRRFLEHRDKAVFTCLLTGFARSESPEALDILSEYLKDDEAWVRQLARALLDDRAAARQERWTELGRATAVGDSNAIERSRR
jgi:hypothetical protein